MGISQKDLQKDWYNHGEARCSLDLAGKNNEAHFARLNELVGPNHDGQALEIGCGNGWYYGRFGDTVGIDISLNSIRGNGDKQWKALAADAEALPFKDASFSLVYGFAVLHHLEDIGRGLKEASRVLKPGGRIAFGSENSALCPLNYLFPVLYGNWHIEKGFTRITVGNLQRAAENAGLTDFQCRFGGFAIYGMNQAVYRATKRIEELLSRSALVNRFSGFMYFTARKP